MLDYEDMDSGISETIEYSSIDGQTYTMNEAKTLNLNTFYKFDSSDTWNDNLSKFLKTQIKSFKGLYEYKYNEDNDSYSYEFADTQLSSITAGPEK